MSIYERQNWWEKYQKSGGLDYRKGLIPISYVVLTSGYKKKYPTVQFGYLFIEPQGDSNKNSAYVDSEIQKYKLKTWC